MAQQSVICEMFETSGNFVGSFFFRIHGQRILFIAFWCFQCLIIVLEILLADDEAEMDESLCHHGSI